MVPALAPARPPRPSMTPRIDYRLIADAQRLATGADVRLFSRNRLLRHEPAIARAIADLPVSNVVLDGESDWDGGGAYHVFDILWLEGRSVTALPLHERQTLLENLPLRPPLRRVPALDGDSPWERLASFYF